MPETAGARAASVLAIDFGLRRMGLAAGQTITGTASPIGSISARDGAPDWAELDRIVDEWRPHCLVVGLPLNMDGTESPMSKRARRFARRLAQRHSIRVELTDERLTTREAKQLQPDSDNHAEAARLIAETWLGEQVGAGS